MGVGIGVGSGVEVGDGGVVGTGTTMGVGVGVAVCIGIAGATGDAVGRDGAVGDGGTIDPTVGRGLMSALEQWWGWAPLSGAQLLVPQVQAHQCCYTQQEGSEQFQTTSFGMRFWMG